MKNYKTELAELIARLQSHNMGCAMPAPIAAHPVQPGAHVVDVDYIKTWAINPMLRLICWTALRARQRRALSEMVQRLKAPNCGCVLPAELIPAWQHCKPWGFAVLPVEYVQEHFIAPLLEIQTKKV